MDTLDLLMTIILTMIATLVVVFMIWSWDISSLRNRFRRVFGFYPSEPADDPELRGIEQEAVNAVLCNLARRAAFFREREINIFVQWSADPEKLHTEIIANRWRRQEAEDAFHRAQTLTKEAQYDIIIVSPEYQTV